LINSSQSKNVLYFESVKSIPKNIWDQLDCSNNHYFTSDYLAAIEENNAHLTFFYVVLKDTQQKAIAFASIQIINFHLNSIENDFSTLVKRVTSLARKFKIIPKEKPLQILTCGNSFVSGEHGIFIKNDQDKRTVLKKLSKTILLYTQRNYEQNQIDIYIMKDFVEQSLQISNELISQGYYSFNVEPNMKLTINTNWQNFDDYLAALKTKFRVKAKKAMQLSSGLLIEDVTSENIDNQLQQMTALYKKVATKADFNLGEFKLSTYKDLKLALQDSYILKTFWLKNKMVGFMSGMINNNELDAHFVGIDYELNRPHAIYQRMLYDYIDIAIKEKLTTINFGRTASEIKSSVGAFPEHLTVYIRHNKSITNKFLKLFLLKIQPTEFNQKFPFKLDTKK
jgi:predicted N-acyltransferase